MGTTARSLELQFQLYLLIMLTIVIFTLLQVLNLKIRNVIINLSELITLLVCMYSSVGLYSVSLSFFHSIGPTQVEVGVPTILTRTHMQMYLVGLPLLIPGAYTDQIK